MLDSTHKRSHTQTTSIRKTPNDKARKDYGVARNNQRKKTKKRKSWLRSIIKLHDQDLNLRLSLEIQTLTRNKKQQETLSSLKLQQFNLVPYEKIHNYQMSKGLSLPHYLFCLYRLYQYNQWRIYSCPI